MRRDGASIPTARPLGFRSGSPASSGVARGAFANGCRQCGQRNDCLPANLSEEGMERLEQVLACGRMLANGDVLFRQHQALGSVYAVRSGCFKSTRRFPDGHEQVCAFHMPGELVGLDALYAGHYQCDVVALDTATVCAFIPADLADLSRDAPTLHFQLLRMASRELTLFLERDTERPAENRMAGFLLQLGERMREQGWSSKRFRLAMSRRDIANYLGLAPETVSRTLRRMESRELIRVDRREVELLQPQSLRDLADGQH